MLAKKKDIHLVCMRIKATFTGTAACVAPGIDRTHVSLTQCMWLQNDNQFVPVPNGTGSACEIGTGRATEGRDRN